MAQDILELNGTQYELGAKAENVSYNNSVSGMTATNVKDALDEIAARPQGGGGGGTYAPFAGKKMAVIGDSYTAMGAGSTGWFDVMCRILGATMQCNTAVSGGHWFGYIFTDQNAPLSTYPQAEKLVSEVGNNHPDYILVTLGLNDLANDADSYLYGNDKVDLGQIVYPAQHDGNELNHFDLTTEPYSFTAGVQATLTYLKRHFPNAIIKIGWTPSGLSERGFLYPAQGKDPWQVFHSYLDRLQDLAMMYGVDYIDTISCGISYWLTEDFEAYSVDTRPGHVNTHPNDAARQRIGEYMARLMLGNL